MTLITFIKFCTASAAIIFIPGPTTLLLAHYAIIHGKKIAKYTIPAVALGDLIALTITFSGLGALISKYPQGMFILKLFGGLYLLILGLMSIFKPKDLNDTGHVIENIPVKKIFMHIVFITSFNPESVIFLLAFFAGFMNIEDSTLDQMLILGSAYITIGVICSILYTLAADKIRVWNKSPVFRKSVNLVTGILLISFGIILMLSK